ncbi:P-type Ca2+ transporter type 2C [Microdochium nivale]|nr:P-type Ca2+ transporter type 2C [Microdochium nivale]
MASNSLAPSGHLTVDTQGRGRSDTAASDASFVSQVSNPFLTPAPSDCGASFVTDDAETALRPDPGTEADFQVENNPFAFTPGHLNKLLNPKSLSAFKALGGLEGIERGLQSDCKTGLSIDETTVKSTVSFEQATRRNSDKFPAASERLGGNASEPFADRIRVYGNNVLPAKKATPFWRLCWLAYNDNVIILLTVAAVISLALGIYEIYGVEHADGEQPLDWIEGVAIVAAILIVTLVGSLNDWQKERAFVKLNAKKEDREVKVLRSGKSSMISVHDVLAGDVLHLEPGDLVPVDGIFIEGHDLKCDESSATGESDALRKTSGHEVMRQLEAGGNIKNLDPFIISGAKVLEGVGTYMVTSVGTNSSFGKIMMSVRTEIEATPLQKKLEGLAVAIAKIGGSSAALLFFILLFRFVAGLSTNTAPGPVKASQFMDILIVAITIIVVAVPEGLPLAVTLALAIATKRMLKENNLVRVLRACETMGNATTICSDKTGTLTTNKMTVVAGTFGNTSFFKDAEPGNTVSTPAQWASGLSQATKDALVQSVAINSTAFEGVENGEFAFIGSKTETALLSLVRDHLGMQSLPEARANEQTVQMFPFDSGKKCMGAVIKLRDGSGHRLLVKGASEILLGYSSEKTDLQTLATTPLTDSDRKNIGDVIDKYAKKSLRTIGLIYRDFAQWPPAHAELSEEGSVQFGSLLKELVFLGVVGIQDPVRPGVPEAVRKAQHAGVTVRMVTGDNAVTAQAIATECGIYTDGLIMEGPEFRALSEAEMDAKLPRLQVLARSSPEDKRILVARLKHLGETVAVTGDGTNDAPALKAADVGFSMGICGTEVAKEASEIVLMDDNFASILTALKWGRAVNDAVQKFLQFQITVNITAVLLAFISAVSDPNMHSVLTAVQLLWVNLIMDTFAALALATDPPTDKVLDRKPQPKSAPLITTNMWKMIIGQAIFQLTVTLIFHFAGMSLMGYPNTTEARLELNTMIFNMFVWMQIFNEFNNRRLDNKFNIFEGVQRNQFFIFINMLMVGLQVAIIYVGGKAFEIKAGGLNGTQWGICVGVAAICLPWAILVRLFPDPWFATLVRIFGGPVAKVFRATRGGFKKAFRVFKKDKKNVDEETASDSANANNTNVTNEKQVPAVANNNNNSAATPVVSSPTVEAPEITVSPVGPAPPAIKVDDLDAPVEEKKGDSTK